MGTNMIPQFSSPCYYQTFRGNWRVCNLSRNRRVVSSLTFNVNWLICNLVAWIDDFVMCTLLFCRYCDLSYVQLSPILILYLPWPLLPLTTVLFLCIYSRARHCMLCICPEDGPRPKIRKEKWMSCLCRVRDRRKRRGKEELGQWLTGCNGAFALLAVIFILKLLI